MTHRGPFQPLPFCDSVIFKILNFCLNALRPEPGNEMHGRLHLAPSQRNASYEQYQVRKATSEKALEA